MRSGVGSYIGALIHVAIGRKRTVLSRSERIYLDHAATTPILPEAAAAMTVQLGRVGNASSLHASGRDARRVVEESREAIAASLGSRPGEVVFTSGGTESDNLAIKGLFWARRAEDPRRVRILSTPIEHHAVLDPLMWLAYVAGATTTIRLGTGILILPQRNPIVLAKEVATLDRLSSATRDLSRFSRSAAGLGSVLGGTLCLASSAAHAFLPLPSSISSTTYSSHFTTLTAFLASPSSPTMRARYLPSASTSSGYGPSVLNSETQSRMAARRSGSLLSLWRVKDGFAGGRTLMTRVCSSSSVV